MKRTRDLEIAEMATCLTLLSRVGKTDTGTDPSSSASPRVFSCKTCNRQFASFQALGGHRTSHKKPRLTSEGDEASDRDQSAKPKTHECPICGLDFPIGQALGGHMRRHRNAVVARQNSETSRDHKLVPVMKRSASIRDACLDLNLAPREIDLNLRLGLVL